MNASAQPGISRRRLLRAGSTGTVVLAGLAAGCTAAREDAAGDAPPSDQPTGSSDTLAETQPTREAQYLPFEGVHQTGITHTPVAAQGLVAAFDVTATERDGLRTLMQNLTTESRALMAGEEIPQRDPAFPPVDSGLLGEQPPPDNLTIVVSVGDSLFDDRFGLADRKPVELRRMPFLANDRLDPERSHGDILISIEAEHADTIQFALRQLMRATRREMVLRWMVDGYTRGTNPRSGAGAPRNLLGFKDGTANLDASDEELMDRFVWLAEEDDQPAWAVGGSYHVVRQIRMFVEFWDRTQLAEQEALIGRHKLSGAPLGEDAEDVEPDYSDDPDGEVIALDAHIRLANPRTPESEESLILRRGFNFSRGFDRAGQLDQGLAFVCYQRSLEKGFLTVQGRLSGEPLEEYIVTVGGGFFFALPGVTDAAGHLGEGLLA
ncbi:iron uptake transporter deferrochelatase/peroxidase subunit [Euzebya tangerina]|uniref:iron uptake transporter deferrochelatase/peroxidase subunit n=1 Tax=Euzebya tangerina TaxID=591198 RepID=UPI000E316573|nr:iron uptake transporter deferrochelatase/peroxidase subunit [Euzebya tangerina]